MCRPHHSAPISAKTKLAGPADGGFALVVVLFIIVILAMLAVAMLVMGQYRTQDSNARMAMLDSDIATEMALNIVQAQIRDATRRGLRADGTVAESWASQPGAIRTFAASGTNATAIYKLYSSDVMIESTRDFIIDHSDVPNDWSDRPDEYVDLNEPVKRKDSWIFPIVSPNSIGKVAGLASSRADDLSNAWDDRLAMPARWLYISRDGTISPDSTVGDPIARVAFWTDDESCKINVNTASATDQASFWDIPRATLKYDVRELSLKQPAQNEFNRYPGHPATVSLTTVFPDLLNQGNAWLKTVMETTPRYQWGGSENGTLTINNTRTPITNSKHDRLYATMDEYLYKPDRELQLNLTANELEESRFFLTASSRSSELNLFGQPRVTIWPVHASDDNLHRTAFDQLIAFCSTIGTATSKRSYYFVRANALSQTQDWSNYPRNQELFEYLQAMTARDIPGFSGNFENKYDVAGRGVSGERDQILTEIFDHIRCANLNETYSGVPSGYQGFTTMLRDDSGAVAITRSGTDQNKFAGAGFVLPLVTPYGRGAGRAPVISEVGLWFIQTVESATTSVVIPKVEPGIIVETNTPMQGLMPWQPYQRSVEIAVSPDGPIPRINGVPLPTGESEKTAYGPSSGISDSQSLGGANGWVWLSANVNTLGTNRFFTKKSDGIPAPDGHITLTGGALEIRLKSDGVIYQTCRVLVPSGTFPIPDPVVAAPIINGNMAGREGWIKRSTSPNTPVEFFPEDVVQAVALRDGDARIAAYLQIVPSGFFSPHANFGLQRFAHGFRLGFGVMDYGATNGSIANFSYGTRQDALASGRRNPAAYSAQPDIPYGIISLRDKGWEGDYDNGYGGVLDGGYLGKSDEGAYNWRTTTNEANEPPYYEALWKLGDGLFSPLRQMPSPVVFGSLPTGVKRTAAAYANGTPADAAPWRTLVFCPNPANPNHFGLTQNPPDHLLLDLFTMPCVEPYAISEPFSIAGRLNMNYGIVPFSYIERSTPMRAALAAQKIVAIPDTAASIYKTVLTASANDSVASRLSVNVDETLKQWTAKFSNGNIFSSATEICAQFLVPQGATLDSVKSNWWDSYRLTGDNSRERPYASLYPLLTTRSSTFTVHTRAQAIKRLKSGKINVLSESRVSQLFERYIDPNDPDIGKDKTVDPDKVSLEPYFRFRTILTKKFNP